VDEKNNAQRDTLILDNSNLRLYNIGKHIKYNIKTSGRISSEPEHYKKDTDMTKTLKLTTRGRYALMAMIELGNRSQANPAPLVEVAERANISLSYLEQLIAGLRKHGLVRSYRGPGGGYALAKQATEITIPAILMAAEDSTPAKRKTQKSGKKTTNCEYTDNLWDFIGQNLYKSLQDTTLQDVLDKNLT
tara:strand:- start:353 stop:922 length:570 start_codon:yes stop_codon:yes gene_type:complete